MKSLLKGFLLGFATGAVVGLLASPRTGAENQIWMRQHVQQAVEAGQQAAERREAQLRARFQEKVAGQAEEQPQEA